MVTLMAAGAINAQRSSHGSVTNSRVVQPSNCAPLVEKRSDSGTYT
jgi:hypothetical protein